MGIQSCKGLLETSICTASWVEGQVNWVRNYLSKAEGSLVGRNPLRVESDSISR